MKCVTFGALSPGLQLLCVSPPGYSYRVRIKAYYTEYPSNNVLTVTSDEFDLHFPEKLKNTADKPAGKHRHNVAKNINRRNNTNDEFSINVIGESLDGSLKGLAACRNKLLKSVDLELRLYLTTEQSYGDVQAFERILVKSGIALNEPVAYAARILAVRFKFTAPELPKLADIEVPGLLGW